MADEQICPQCGELFEPRSHCSSTYCGYRCSALARETKLRGGPPATKKCLACGKTFQKNNEYSYAVWAKIRCCSIACRGNGRPKTSKTCAFCKQEFYPADRGRSLAAKYCRDECYFLSLRTERYPVNRPYRTARNFSHKQKRLLLEQANYQCARCGATENLEADHIIPVWNDGTNDLANGQILCYPCHRQKTNGDVDAYWATALARDPS